jgi:anti-anti-sigma factor
MDSGITVNPSLDISTRTVDGILIAELAGELDIASAPVLREQLLSLLEPGSSRLFVDLSEVSLCDASGLAVLVGISHRARLLGGFLRLAAVSPQADQVLQITGLHRHLPISPPFTQPQPVPPTPGTAERAQSPKLPLPSGWSSAPGAEPPSAETERAATGGACAYSVPAAAMSLAQPRRMRVITPAA